MTLHNTIIQNMQNSLIQILKKDIFRSTNTIFPNTDKIHASVTCILKNGDQRFKKSKWNYEVLFLKRKVSQNDRFSGHICFPGGKIQPGQAEIDAAIRQTKEQTGISLHKSNLLAVMKPFRVYAGPQKTINTRCFIFLANDPYIKVNEHQISEFIWFPISNFLSNPKSYFTSFQYRYPTYPFINSLLNEDLQMNNLSKNFESIVSPALNLGMQIPLWGATFAMSSYIINKVYEFCIYTEKMGRNQKLQQFLNFANSFSVKFRAFPDKQKYEQITTQHYRQTYQMYNEVFPYPRL